MLWEFFGMELVRLDEADYTKVKNTQNAYKTIKSPLFCANSPRTFSAVGMEP